MFGHKKRGKTKKERKPGPITKARWIKQGVFDNDYKGYRSLKYSRRKSAGLAIKSWRDWV